MAMKAVRWGFCICSFEAIFTFYTFVAKGAKGKVWGECEVEFLCLSRTRPVSVQYYNPAFQSGLISVLKQYL